MISEKIVIVNEDDEIIKIKERKDLDIKKDLFRISALVVYNSKNEILLSKRRKDKKLDGGKWGASVTGTNEKNETYKENIIKEAQEEIGLNLLEFSFKESVKVKNETPAEFFVQWFIVKVDENLSFFKKQKSEVDELRWISIKELEKELVKSPEKFTVSMKMHYEAVKNFEKDLFNNL